MNSRCRRWLKIILFVIPLLYLAYLALNQIRFEHFLKTLFITFDDLDVAVAQELLHHTSSDKAAHSKYVPGDLTIPPNIHFIWFRDLYDTEISHTGSRAPDVCREHNPEFEIHIWDASEARSLLEEHFAWFLPTYDGYLHPIQCVDAFKYFVLLYHGGIYMDLDTSCRRSLAPLLAFPAWFPEASPLGVNNDLMASRPGHPAMKMMTEKLRSRNRNLLFPYLTIFWTTGPQYTSDVLHMWWIAYKGRKYMKGIDKRSNPDWFYLLPREFYSEQYSFFGHSPGGTWHGSDVATVLWLVQRPWIIVCGGLSLIIPCAIVLHRRRKHRRRLLLDPERSE